MKNIVCICCPIGCHLSVDYKDKTNIIVTGNKCPRGIKYAKDEIIAPKRMVTSIVMIKNGTIKAISVKTREPIAKDKIFECLDSLKQITLYAPIYQGDVIISNVCGTGVDVIATKTVCKEG